MNTRTQTDTEIAADDTVPAIHITREFDATPDKVFWPTSTPTSTHVGVDHMTSPPSSTGGTAAPVGSGRSISSAATTCSASTVRSTRSAPTS